MVSAPVIVIGAGGHARVVVDALLAAGARVLGCTDADPARHGGDAAGVPVLGDDTVLARHSPSDVQLAVGIGGARGESLRRRIHERLKAAGWTLATVRHPSAIVSPSAWLGEGVQVMAGAIVQPGARIGDGAIVNTAAVIEHDCDVGAFVHVAPRALLCGDVRIGAGSHVGAGAVVRQAVTIGEGVVIAAGAVVVRDFSGPGTLAGVPALARDRTQ